MLDEENLLNSNAQIVMQSRKKYEILMPDYYEVTFERVYSDSRITILEYVK